MEVNTQINFCGRYKRIRDKVIPDNRMNEHVLGKDNKLIISHLPLFWIQPDENTNFKENFKNFDKDFRVVVEEVADVQFCKYYVSQNYSNDDDDLDFDFATFQKNRAKDEEKILEVALTKLLQQYGFVKKGTVINVNRIKTPHPTNYGLGYNITFKDNCNRENKVFLKIFHRNYKSHQYNGKIPEITRFMFLEKNMVNKKNFPEFYFGSIAYTAPYLFAEFIPDDAKNKHWQYPHSLLGLKFTDHSQTTIPKHNAIGDYYIDSGKIIPINSLGFDKTARGIAKKIFRLHPDLKLQYWYKLFDSHNSDKNSQIAGLVYAIKYLPKEKQKDCFEKVLQSDYATAHQVQLAILCENYLCDLIFDDKTNKKIFLTKMFNDVVRMGFSSKYQKEYLANCLKD